MAKAKKAAAKKEVKKMTSKFQQGQRVKVLAGDYGNARGTVDGQAPAGMVCVQLDNNAHGDHILFESGNLVAL